MGLSAGGVKRELVGGHAAAAMAVRCEAGSVASLSHSCQSFCGLLTVECRVGFGWCGW
jgi:hypothetical protein